MGATPSHGQLNVSGTTPQKVVASGPANHLWEGQGRPRQPPQLHGAGPPQRDVGETTADASATSTSCGRATSPPLQFFLPTTVILCGPELSSWKLSFVVVVAM